MTVVTKQDIKNTLTQLGVSAGDIVIFHSSLKSMGRVEGGPQTVIDAFLEQVGAEGTVVVPTLLKENYFVAYEIWNKDTTPSEVGLITEVFRTMPGTLRSDQPTHSVAARGKLAEEITREHCAYGPRPGFFGEYAFSHSSPWQKLYEHNAKMVFIGVSTLYGTMRHLVEYVVAEKVLAIHPEAMDQLRVYGSPWSGTFWPDIKWRPFEQMFRDNGLLRTAICGNATFLCVEAKPFVDTELELVIKEPTVYTDLKQETNPTWVSWIRDIDDTTMTPKR